MKSVFLLPMLAVVLFGGFASAEVLNDMDCTIQEKNQGFKGSKRLLIRDMGLLSAERDRDQDAGLSVDFGNGLETKATVQILGFDEKASETQNQDVWRPLTQKLALVYSNSEVAKTSGAIDLYDGDQKEKASMKMVLTGNTSIDAAGIRVYKRSIQISIASASSVEKRSGTAHCLPAGTIGYNKATKKIVKKEFNIEKMVREVLK